MKTKSGMKQRITKRQLRELSKKGRYNLDEWCEGREFKYCGWDWDLGLPLLTIGYMIEFLKPYYASDHRIIVDSMFAHVVGDVNLSICWEDYDELCDVLWEAVKLRLEDNG